MLTAALIALLFFEYKIISNANGSVGSITIFEYKLVMLTAALVALLFLSTN